MKEENKKIEELNGMELLILIYEEVKNNKEEVQNVGKELDTKFNYLEEKIDANYKELKEEINNNFKYLDEKIDSTKNTMVEEIAEELKNISVITEERIDNLNKKIENEIEDRKADVSKIKEFNKIILNDIRSRVCILEEQSEKYNLN